MPRISRRNPTAADLLHDGTLIASAVLENRDDLPNLQDTRADLEAKLALIRDLDQQALTLQAKKQAIVKQINGLQDEAAKLISFLHTGVKHRYGNRNEILTKFGLQPFRGVRRRSRTGAPAPADAGTAASEAPREQDGPARETDGAGQDLT